MKETTSRAASAENYRIMVINAAGKEIMPDRAENMLTTATLCFLCPKNQAKQVVYCSRPYAKKIMQNISLQAGNLTHPTIIQPTEKAP
ncbi:MAG TPA: hypothetical protein VGF52_04010 [Tepidisphaeraceae bacterium]